MRRLATALMVALAGCGCGSSSAGPAAPEVPENASPDQADPGATEAIGYFAAGTVGQNPETGALEFTGNPLAVAWVDGQLRPLAGPDDAERAVAAFRQARQVSGLDGAGRVVRVAIGPADPRSEGMFTMRLGGAVEGSPEARSVLLALPGTRLEPVSRAAAPVSDGTAAEQAGRLRAALRARPPHDECSDSTYDVVEDIGAASGARLGEGGPLAVSYRVTVNTRARTSTGEAVSVLFVGAASSVERPYLGLCRDNPAWRADPELAVRLDGRATFLLVISACGCEQETWHLLRVPGQATRP